MWEISIQMDMKSFFYGFITEVTVESCQGMRVSDFQGYCNYIVSILNSFSHDVLLVHCYPQHTCSSSFLHCVTA